MKKKKLRWPWILFGVLGIFILGLAGLWGGNIYMQHEKEKALYRHGFRLLEEQIAIYIKNHYKGVDRIEFSPIFIEHNGTMEIADVVPVIYDKHNNRARLGTEIGGEKFPTYGTSNSLDIDYDGADGSEIIELTRDDTGKTQDLSKYTHLPPKAEISSDSSIDENILALVKDKQLENVHKAQAGSPDATVKYNFNFRNGSIAQWH